MDATNSLIFCSEFLMSILKIKKGTISFPSPVSFVRDKGKAKGAVYPNEFL